MRDSGRVPKQWLGAFKAGHRKASREFIDETLSWEMLNRVEASNGTDKEAADTLDYITKFNNEFHKNVVKKGDPNALHSSDMMRKDCYARENARNRDIYRADSMKQLYIHTIYPHNTSPEDIIVELIDIKKTQES